MKRSYKRVNDRNFKKFAKLNHLSNKNVISLDDKKAKKYLDQYVYQEYLQSLNESSDFDE